MAIYRAHANRQRISPTKVRRLADLIRTRPAEEALATLQFSPQVGAKILRHLLESAIANAEHNFGADVDELIVGEVYVNEGARLKRVRPRARGRANRIVKRGCHITLSLTEMDADSKFRG